MKTSKFVIAALFCQGANAACAAKGAIPANEPYLGEVARVGGKEKDQLIVKLHQYQDPINGDITFQDDFLFWPGYLGAKKDEPFPNGKLPSDYSFYKNQITSQEYPMNYFFVNAEETSDNCSGKFYLCENKPDVPCESQRVTTIPGISLTGDSTEDQKYDTLAGTKLKVDPSLMTRSSNNDFTIKYFGPNNGLDDNFATCVVFEMDKQMCGDGDPQKDLYVPKLGETGVHYIDFVKDGSTKDVPESDLFDKDGKLLTELQDCDKNARRVFYIKQGEDWVEAVDEWASTLQYNAETDKFEIDQDQLQDQDAVIEIKYVIATRNGPAITYITLKKACVAPGDDTIKISDDPFNIIVGGTTGTATSVIGVDKVFTSTDKYCPLWKSDQYELKTRSVQDLSNKQKEIWSLDPETLKVSVNIEKFFAEYTDLSQTITVVVFGKVAYANLINLKGCADSKAVTGDFVIKSLSATTGSKVKSTFKVQDLFTDQGLCFNTYKLTSDDAPELSEDQKLLVKMVEGQVEVDEDLFDGTELTLYVEASGVTDSPNFKLYKEFKIQMNCDDAITASETELVLSAIPEATEKVRSGDILEKEYFKFKTGTSKDLCKPKSIVVKDDQGAEITFEDKDTGVGHFGIEVDKKPDEEVVELDPTKYKDGLDYTFWLELTDSNDKKVTFKKVMVKNKCAGAISVKAGTADPIEIKMRLKVEQQSVTEVSIADYFDYAEGAETCASTLDWKDHKPSKTDLFVEIEQTDTKKNLRLNDKYYEGADNTFTVELTNIEEKVNINFKIIDKCKPNALEFKADAQKSFKALKGDETKVESTEKWSDMLEDGACAFEAKVVKNEQGDALDTDLLMVDSVSNKLQMDPSKFTEDATVYLEVTSRSDDKIYHEIKISEDCPKGKLTRKEEVFRIKGIVGDPTPQTYFAVLADQFEVDFDADTCPLTLSLWQGNKEAALSGEDAELVKIIDGKLVVDQERYTGDGKFYQVRAEIPNNDPVYTEIAIDQAKCNKQGLTANDKDEVKLIEATEGAEGLVKFDVSTLFTNSEEYLCTEVTYEVTDLDGKKEGLANEIFERMGEGSIQLNQKTWDGKPLHLQVSAKNEWESGKKAIKYVTFLAAGAKCKARTLALTDEKTQLYEIPFLSAEATASGGSITDLFTNKEVVGSTCEATIELEGADGKELTAAQKAVLTMAEDGKVTLGLANFRESFSGRVKVNTAFGQPIYKSFMVIQENTYRETKGPCSSAGEAITQDNVLSGNIDMSQDDCKHECNSLSGCVGFTWTAKDGEYEKICLTIGGVEKITAGDAEAAGTCYRRVRNAFDGQAALAIAFKDILDVELKEGQKDKYSLYEIAFYTKLFHMKETVAAVPEAQRTALDACLDALPAPAVVDKAGLDYAKYVAAMDKIVDGHFSCLRAAYDAEMENADAALQVPTFYVPKLAYCGPTGTVDEEAKGEQSLGLRCVEGACCSLAQPPKEDDAEGDEGKELEIHTCQDPEATAFQTAKLSAYASQEWTQTCLVQLAKSLVVGLAITTGMVSMLI